MLADELIKKGDDRVVLKLHGELVAVVVRGKRGKWVEVPNLAPNDLRHQEIKARAGTALALPASTGVRYEKVSE